MKRALPPSVPFRLGFCLWGLLLLTGAGVVEADIRPGFLDYQGCLLDPQGRPLPDAARSMTFRIWDRATDGSVLWTENQTIATTDGYYHVRLGIVTPLPADFHGTRWLGVQVNQEPEQVPRVELSPTDYSYNADMVDGYHAQAGGQAWAGAGYGDGLSKTRSFWIRGDAGPKDLYVPIVHFSPFHIVLTCPHAAPQESDIACADCVENDGRVSCLGIDGSGAQVRSTFALSSTGQILSARGGHVTLSCPGDGSRRFRIHTEGEWVVGYIGY